MKLKGRTVAVTGGTSGIGFELVKLLTIQCDEVIVIARNKTAMNKLSSTFPNVVCYHCCIDKKNELEATIDTIIKRHPELSVFINNAGIQNVPTFLDDRFNYEGIEQELAINLMAPIWITALTLGHFLACRSNTAFVNITSGLAIYPKTTSAVYCASKAGLRNFTKSLRYQLEETTVSVFEAVMPMVDTPMTRGRGRKKLKASNAAQALIKGIESGKPTIYIGLARLIPIISRVSPGLIENLLRRG